MGRGTDILLPRIHSTCPTQHPHVNNLTPLSAAKMQTHRKIEWELTLCSPAPVQYANRHTSRQNCEPAERAQINRVGKGTHALLPRARQKCQTAKHNVSTLAPLSVPKSKEAGKGTHVLLPRIHLTCQVQTTSSAYFDPTHSPAEKEQKTTATGGRGRELTVCSPAFISHAKDSTHMSVTGRRDQSAARGQTVTSRKVLLRAA